MNILVWWVDGYGTKDIQRTDSEPAGTKPRLTSN